MIDNIKFATEMANQLNIANFQMLTSVMAEHAAAYSSSGIQCGQANMLADVYSEVQSKQYSVKTYKDKFVSLYMNEDISEDRKFTDFIIERRISGVSDPNAASDIVFDEVLKDIYENELKSKNHYNVRETNTVLVGYDEDDQYFYFRITEVPFEYKKPSTTSVKEFTEKSKNFKKHEGNRCSINGYDENGVHVYEWVSPNCQTYTRCLKKRYNLEEHESFYFKVKKQGYTRPADSELMGMIYF
ncbi:Uncharacterised protein [Escherichia coli]|uniref:hypothetical protein n=1 Tax=Escherichia coli TaxID=562 RepID=UPI001A4A5311|nr:hypothetical protein [Escherichia coli]EHV4443642.1 hypothetical protein [Escherichia coli]VVZ30066.1 Uncharacterised protein [Escherichia coli]VVZ35197.1 Uncharacterised protein [Escherichia coli]VWN21667.1 Uncharacterised protein [Escherichia coli]HBB9485744.1 hypothetical protein [Escherichia coli]